MTFCSLGPLLSRLPRTFHPFGEQRPPILFEGLQVQAMQSVPLICSSLCQHPLCARCAVSFFMLMLPTLPGQTSTGHGHEPGQIHAVMMLAASRCVCGALLGQVPGC